MLIHVSQYRIGNQQRRLRESRPCVLQQCPVEWPETKNALINALFAYGELSPAISNELAE